MLSVSKVNAFYGKVQVLFDIDVEVNDKEIISIIGSNGAGKSTLMKTIVGLVKAKSGSVKFNDTELTKLSSSKAIYNGIAYVPEGREIFGEMTVRDNLEMGAFCKKYSPKEMEQHVEEMYDLFPRLRERKKQVAGSLSGGEQQMLAIARGLMSEPKLLMLDEPSLGLAPVIVEEVFKVISAINKERNLPVILVEQNAYMALRISNRCYVLENGRIPVSGDSTELIQSDTIIKSYLGG